MPLFSILNRGQEEGGEEGAEEVGERKEGAGRKGAGKKGEGRRGRKDSRGEERRRGRKEEGRKRGAGRKKESREAGRMGEGWRGRYALVGLSHARALITIDAAAAGPSSLSSGGCSLLFGHWPGLFGVAMGSCCCCQVRCSGCSCCCVHLCLWTVVGHCGHGRSWAVGCHVHICVQGQWMVVVGG